MSDNQFIFETRNFHKIKNIDRKQYGDMVGMILAKAINLAGFKKKVDEIHKADVSKMLLTKYKNMTLEEIDKAFELDRYSDNPEKHYDLFNSTYVSKVLTKYNTWKNRKKNHYQIGKEKVELKLTEEQKKDNHEQIKRNIFKTLQNHDYDRDAWLLYDKIDCYQKNDDDYKKILHQAQVKKYYVQQKKDGNTKDAYSEFFKQNQKTNYIVNRCKSIIVCDYLRKYKDDYRKFNLKINSI